MDRPTERSLDHPSPAPLAGRPHGKLRRWLWLGAGLVLAAVGGYFAYRYFAPAPGPESQTAAGRPGGPPGAKQPTPVVAVPAGTGEIDVYLTGLGTSTPLRTVAVKSRVTGQLMRVLFQEGEIVKEGQLLAEIDPRPFQVMLVQAEGQMARDKALLENAQIGRASGR